MKSATKSEKKYSGSMVLAMSWQAGFCETRPRLRECKSQTATRFDARHFSLHGLWPQPGTNIYCGVSNRDRKKDKNRKWKKLAGLGLPEGLKKRLWQGMPGSRSFLHRHEWVKHGTCYASDPETYYRDSLAVLDQVNRSAVQELFANSIGKPLSSHQIRQSFDEAFGQGAGKRVRVSCKRDGERQLITEITLGLGGRISDTPDMTSLILASPETKAGCPEGIVDAVGLQ